MQVLVVESTGQRRLRFAGWTSPLFSIDTVDFLIRLRYACQILDLQKFDKTMFEVLVPFGAADFIQNVGIEFETREKAEEFCRDGQLTIADSASIEGPLATITRRGQTLFIEGEWLGNWSCYVRLHEARESFIDQLANLSRDKLYARLGTP